MEIIQIVGLGFVVTTLALVIKQERPELALQLSLALAIIIFIFLLNKIQLILDLFYQLAEKANVGKMYLNTLLKIVGIAYITEFGAQICRDAGEQAIASKIEFAGKLFIMVMAVPIIALVLDTVTQLMP